jgi:trk system potassium uptake protein TrkH
MVKFSGSLLKYPARAALGWYLGMISLGALALMTPWAVLPGVSRLSVIDAVFTSTSATCVTGLTVRSTANELSLFGQMIVLLQLQLGGIGIMTVTTFLILRFGARETVRQKVILAQSVGSAENDLRALLWSMLRLVAVCEGVGFVIMAIRNLALRPAEQSVSQAVWEAFFHTISAFCNAGFALYDASLAPFRRDLVVNLTVMALIIIGGLGFPVVMDLRRSTRHVGLRGWEALTMHSKMILIGTAALLSFGTLIMLLLEWNNVLLGMPVWEKLVVAMFQSATTRTAGFETVQMGRLTNATLFVFMLLMLIGAGPASTAGGFKVSTFMVLVYHAWSRFRGALRVTLFRRSVAQVTVDGALATTLLFAVVTVVALVGILIVEQAHTERRNLDRLFLESAFEVCSALGTVGLSTGITPHLTTAGKAILIMLMFLGRLGPISVFVAISRSERRHRLEYPKEEVLIG